MHFYQRTNQILDQRTVGLNKELSWWSLTGKYETSRNWDAFFRYKEPCPTLQMKRSFPPKSSGAPLNPTEILFLVFLPIWLLLICHEFVHVMRRWPAHISNLFPLWSQRLSSDSYYIFFFFIFLKKNFVPRAQVQATWQSSSCFPF